MLKYVHIFLGIFLCSYFSHAEDLLSTKEVEQLLIYYKKELDSHPDADDKYQIALNNFPKSSFYKLFIDKYRLSNPEDKEKNVPSHLIFDVKEPGYFNAMNDTFQKLSKHINKPISLEMLGELNGSAVKGVGNIIGGLFKGARKYPIAFSKFNEEAFRELYKSFILLDIPLLLESIAEKSLQPLMSNIDIVKLTRQIGHISYLEPPKAMHMAITGYHSNNAVNISGKLLDSDEFNTNVRLVLNHYYQSIQRSTTLMETLCAISELLRALEVSHIFGDGNQRTYAFLLLPKLLIENGLPPAILEDPCMFDGFMTVSAMGEAILQGITNFLNENREVHRDLLKENISLTNSEWVEGANNYQPYFTTAAAQELVEKFTELNRDHFKEVFKNATTENINRPGQPNWEIDPLYVAILLNDKESVEKLLDLGANPFGNPDNNMVVYEFLRITFVDMIYGIDGVKLLFSRLKNDKIFTVNHNILEVMINSIEYLTTKLHLDCSYNQIIKEISDVIFMHEEKLAPANRERFRKLYDDWVLNYQSDYLCRLL